MENTVTLSPSLYPYVALFAFDQYLSQNRRKKEYEPCEDFSKFLNQAFTRRGSATRASDVIARIQSGLPGRSIGLLQSLLEIHHKEMADILCREDKTIRTWAKREKLSSSASEQVFRLMKVYLAACSVLEDKNEALAWLKEPSEPLGGSTPLELLGTSEGERLVIDELMQMEYAHPV